VAHAPVGPSFADPGRIEERVEAVPPS
jgi:hypothetical protein